MTFQKRLTSLDSPARSPQKVYLLVPDSPTPKALSPCKNICTLDASGSHCTACKRTIQEIAEWSTYPSVIRLKIMAALPNRTFVNSGERFE